MDMDGTVVIHELRFGCTIFGNAMRGSAWHSATKQRIGNMNLEAEEELVETVNRGRRA